MISAALARASATQPAVNSNRSNFSFGRVSVQTTEKHLGCQQRIRGAVNTALELNLSNERPSARRMVHLAVLR